MTKAKSLLIDGDILCYRIASALQTSANWGEGIWTTWADAHVGQAKVDSLIEHYKDTFKPDQIVIAFTDKSNFRYSITPSYKANRVDKPKPIILQDLTDYCFANYPCACWHNLEADDVLGIMATSPEVYGESIILTMDKDLRGIPSTWVNMKDLSDIRKVSEEDADTWHMVQTLAGDVTDGYSGCPGIGVKRAKRFLAAVDPTYEAMWDVVSELFYKQGLSEEEALISARLARILRAEDYDFNKGEVILWLPPQLKD